MGSIEKGFVHYCCVSKGGRILQSYNHDNNNNDRSKTLEIEKLVALCLENVPQFHRWYSQTMNNRTYCYLIEDGFVYFAMGSGSGFGNHALIRFLENYRDEFRKITRRGSGSGSGLRLSWKGKGKNSVSNSNMNSVNLQEQLVPVIRQLITSLQNVSQSRDGSGDGNVLNRSVSPSGGCYGEGGESGSCTKAPLLGNKSGKQEKRRKDHVIGMRGMELEEQRNVGSGDAGATGGPAPLQREVNASRRRLSSQSVRRKWCRLVRLVLAIDAVVCITLLIVWLVICKGVQCVS
ncbi:hypothetical protein vseg_021045 [Gypsophila vaccaria]